MKSYAVIENSTVINLIVAESQEIAEHFTGKQCVESNHVQIVVGSVLVDNVLKPYASWILNDENRWVPPIAQPPIVEGSGTCPMWNHETQTWDMVEVSPAP